MAAQTFVTCYACSQEYALAVPDPTTCQGTKCAAFAITRVEQKYLLGCFGSEYDECLFKILDPDLCPGKDDPICDSCVARLEDEGKLWKIPGHFQMVPLNYKPAAFLS